MTPELIQAAQRLGLPDGLSESIIQEQIARERRNRQWDDFLKARAEAAEQDERERAAADLAALTGHDPQVRYTPPGIAHDAVKALRTLGMLKDRAESRVATALQRDVYNNVAELITAAMVD